MLTSHFAFILGWSLNSHMTANQNSLFFYSTLVSLFSLFCFKCKTGQPKVTMEKNGTLVTVTQHCSNCIGSPFKWRSQPFILGKYPAGNILLSFAVLMAGASISKVLLVFKHLGLSVYEARTYFYHQNKFLFPVVLHHWKTYTTSILQGLKSWKSLSWCGDGRFDSMGHSAKFGVYTMFCSSINKIVHFELVQVQCNINYQNMLSKLIKHTSVHYIIDCLYIDSFLA